MKKLSMMLAVAALVATGCDPYEDAPGGNPEILAVTAAGRTAAGGLRPGIEGTEGTDGQWVLDAVPVGSGGNNVIVVTTNKLLDPSTIQAAQQDPTDATSTGDCRPANGWLQITKAVAGGAPVAEALTYDDPATPEDTANPTADDWQWYSCYYAGAATSSYGASIQIFRAKVSQAPGFPAAGSPQRVARLEPAANYVITGTVKDEAGNDLAINVAVSTMITAPAVNATPTAAGSLTVAWTTISVTGTTYQVFRAPAVQVAGKPVGIFEPGDYAELATGLSVATYTDTAVSDADTVSYFYYVTATPASGSPNDSAYASTKPAAPTVTIKAGPTPTTELVLSWTSTNATSYVVSRATVEAGPFTDLPTPAATVGAPAPITFTDTGLTTGTKYFYKVTAKNLLGAAASSVVSKTPAAPTT
jgi:hypothetical protein